MAFYESHSRGKNDQSPVIFSHIDRRSQKFDELPSIIIWHDECGYTNHIDQTTKRTIFVQQYYAKPVTLGGGVNSFAGLTADATGLGDLASVEFTNNANGSYSIKTA